MLDTVCGTGGTLIGNPGEAVIVCDFSYKATALTGLKLNCFATVGNGLDYIAVAVSGMGCYAGHIIIVSIEFDRGCVAVCIEGG